MKYYRVITSFFMGDDKKFNAFESYCDLEQYKSEDELIDDIKLCLENENVAFVQYQEVTKNVYIRSEVRTARDYVYGNYSQKLYTKVERLAYNTSYLTSYIV